MNIKWRWSSRILCTPAVLVFSHVPPPDSFFFPSPHFWSHSFALLLSRPSVSQNCFLRFSSWPRFLFRFLLSHPPPHIIFYLFFYVARPLSLLLFFFFFVRFLFYLHRTSFFFHQLPDYSIPYFLVTPFWCSSCPFSFFLLFFLPVFPLILPFSFFSVIPVFIGISSI